MAGALSLYLPSCSGLEVNAVTLWPKGNDSQAIPERLETPSGAGRAEGVRRTPVKGHGGQGEGGRHQFVRKRLLS